MVIPQTWLMRGEAGAPGLLGVGGGVGEESSPLKTAPCPLRHFGGPAWGGPWERCPQGR